MDITKQFDRFEFLAPFIKYSLHELLIDIFEDQPSVFDVLISPNISVEFHSCGAWTIKLSIQIIWSEANVWIEPIDLELRINEAGEIFYKSCSSNSFPTRDRFYALTKNSSVWVENSYENF